MKGISYPAESAPNIDLAGETKWTVAVLSGYGVRIIVCVCVIPIRFTSEWNLGMQPKLLYPRRNRIAPFRLFESNYPITIIIFPGRVNIDALVESQKRDGKAKSPKFKARESR